MEFFRNVLSSCLGALIALVLLVILGIMIISGLSADEVVTIEDDSILHLKLEGTIKEFHEEDPIEALLPNSDYTIGLVQLRQVIEHAKNDDKIKGIYLEVDQLQTYFSSMEEIRKALADFKTSGKKVIAYNETLSEGGYYLSSIADKVYLNKVGEVEFNGLVAQFVSFKKLLDKLEINPQVFRVGEFKSAVEPFLMEKMSNENRLQLQAMINSIYGTLLQGISESRGVSVAQLKDISDNMKIKRPEDAVALGLIDSLVYVDEFKKLLKKNLGLKEGKEPKLVTYEKYLKTVSSYVKSDNEIAVIIAEGTIMPGESEGRDGLVGADTFVEEIRKAREDKKVKAIVLRVNSPGGEFRSSDMIWREVTLAAQIKPVIASMGDYAASGGYYISMACDTIVANPQTITGSIGIFGVLFDMSNFFDDKLGITFDEVKTGNYGDSYAMSRPLTQSEKDFWKRSLEEHYKTFLTQAAEGRDRSVDEIKKLAGGRVWTGREAVENGLVDLEGGLNDAIQIAAEKANIADDYKVRYYPKPKTFLETLFQTAEETKADEMKAQLGQYYFYYKKWKEVESYKGIQARLPFEFTME